jgi:hypothetical protein
MAELAELVVLLAISVTLIVVVIFRRGHPSAL